MIILMRRFIMYQVRLPQLLKINICRARLLAVFVFFFTQSGGGGEGQSKFLKIFLYSFNHHFVLGWIDDLSDFYIFELKCFHGKAVCVCLNKYCNNSKYLRDVPPLSPMTILLRTYYIPFPFLYLLLFPVSRAVHHLH